MKNKKIEELKKEIIDHKQIIEQLKTELNKKERFIENNYPTLNNFEIRKGWYGNGTSTYKVIIEVFAEDLHKLIKYFTHRNLRNKKYNMIKQEIKNQIKKEE